MNTIGNSQRTAARIAGASGLLAVVTVIFGNYALLSPLVIRGDAFNTARNIVAHQTQVRLALTCFLAYGASVVVLLSALYVVLRPLNGFLAILGALFRLVFALFWLLTTLNLLSALRLLGSATYLQIFEPDRLQVLATTADRGEFRRLLRRSAFFWIGRDDLRLLMAKVTVHPEGASCFRRRLVCVVCDLCFCFPNFPNLRKNS